jgi:hypothetical protein
MSMRQYIRVNHILLPESVAGKTKVRQIGSRAVCDKQRGARAGNQRLERE